jgi:tetratricopeptide (TPR) repeat protein
MPADITEEGGINSMTVSPSHSSSSTPWDKWTVPGICVLLVVVVFVVFGQTLRHEFVNFDDDLYVYQNPVVIKGLTFQGISHVFTHQMCDFYHPFTMMSLMLDAQVYGLNPGGYHLTNVLLHAANAVLLFLVLRRMMRLRAEASSPQVGLRSNKSIEATTPQVGLGTDNSVGAVATPAGALWPSAFVAAVFALHPLRVESVAWVTERKDMLSGLFFVLTLGAYVRYTRGPFSLVRYLTVIFLFTLGLLSKPTLVTLPFVLLLLDYWPLDRMALAAPRSTFKVWRPLIMEKIPLFVLSAASCVTTIFTQQKSLIPAGHLSLFVRLGNAAVSYITYLGQMIYPADLAVLYPYPEKGLPLAEVTLALALLAGISVGVLVLRRRCPYLVVGWLWYLGMLVPMIGVVHVGSVVRADRFTYLAQLGVYIMLAWAARDLVISWRNSRRMVGVGALSVIVALMVCTWKQTSYWRNSETLWTHTLACTPENYFAHGDLGVALTEQGRLDEAIEHLQKALEIHPGHPECHNNLGNALLQAGQVDEAIEHLQKALQINPGDEEACYNLGNALLQKGNVDEAIAHYQKALQIKPDFTEAHNNLGNALLQKGRVDEAITHCQEAIQLKPDYAEAHFNLANVLARQGKSSDAIGQYQKAIKIKPGYADAHYNLGVVLARQGRLDEAVEQYRETIGMRPDDVNAHGNLAKVLAAQGKFDEAVKEYQRTVELAPDSARAHFGFGQALQSQGDIKAAMAEYRRTMELNSKHLPAHLSLAWLLATSPEASLRDGNQAVELAREAERLGGGESPQLLDTLAAAYAEAGQYPKAVETAKRAQNLTATQNNPPLAEAIQNRLKLYEAGFHYHEKP